MVTNLKFTITTVSMTIIKPLTQLREMISRYLSGQTNLSKSFQSFFIETMELMLTHTGRLNFTQMARCGCSCESRFRQNFRKAFDWFSFNKSFLESTKGHRIAIAIDPCYISKAGKKTPGLDWFWSGCAAAMKKGLEILGISIVDADAKDAGKVDLKNLDMSVFTEDYIAVGKLVCKMYTAVVNAISLGRDVRVVIVDLGDTEKKRQARKVFFSTDASMSARDIFDLYRTRFQLELVFNASLTSVNVARASARQQGMNLSVGSTKTLLHNAAMVDRFIAMSGKSPKMRFNDTVFKELSFYGVRTVA